MESAIAALSPHATGGTLVNMHGRPGDADDRARPWPADTFTRLQRAKSAYDPGNLFRFGHAVAPTDC